MRIHALEDLLNDRADEAVGRLRDRIKTDARNADVWNDLAAALLVRERADDTAAALDAALKASELAPSLSEAAFNQALALERLGLRERASAAWKTHAIVERSEQWRSEGIRRDAAAEQQLAVSGRTLARQALAEMAMDPDRIRDVAAKFPQPVREWIADEGLPAWARRRLANDPGADARLEALQVAAGTLATGGDALTADALKTLNHASAAARDRIARGHLAYAEGRAALEAYDISAAEARYRETLTLWPADYPFAHWSRLNLAIVRYQTNALDRAEMIFDDLRRELAGKPYVALRGRIDWVQSLIHSSRGEFQQALQSQERSARAFETLREAENSAVVRSITAETYWMLGDEVLSWESMSRALALLPAVERAARKRTILFTAGAAAARQGFHSAALVFRDEFLRLTVALNSPIALAEAHVHRAQSLLELGQSAAAETAIRAATDILDQSREPMAPFLRSQAALIGINRLGEAHRSEARERLDAAISYFRTSNRTVWLARAYMARARLRVAQDDQAGAERDLVAGIESFESQLANLTSERLRIAYQDDVWDLYEDLVKVRSSAGRHEEAFAIAERGRARSITDAAPGIAPPTLDDIQRAVPPDTRLVYFARAGDHYLAWSLTRTSRAVARIPLADTDADVRGFTAATRAGRIDAHGGRLSMTLKPLLGREPELVVIPDGALHLLPFAALPDASGEPLVRRQSVTLAPSARFYLISSARRARRSGSKDTTALVAANPYRGVTMLPPLPSAEKEAAEIAAMYPDATLLLGSRATDRAVISGLRRKPTMVHLATHAVANHEYPDLSRFLFAADSAASEMSTLLVADLRALPLQDTSLVVLASCDTAAGRVMRGEGVVSLARPFLAGGVPSVVATLWPLDDRTGRALFTRFHRYIRDGMSPSKALHSAQLAVMDDRSLPPGAWAAAIILGS